MIDLDFSGRKPEPGGAESSRPAPAAPRATGTADARCHICIRPTPRCRVDADGRCWCGGGLGVMPGFEIAEERDGLMCYVPAPVTPLPAPPPAPPFTPAPPEGDITAQFAPEQRDYLRAALRIVEAARRAAACRAAGALGEAERAELDRLEALGDAHAARDRAAMGHLFGERAARELYPHAGPVTEALARNEADIEELAAAVARLERKRTEGAA